MLRLNVELKGMDRASALVRTRAQGVLMKTMLRMEDIAIQKAPFDRGFLRENITLFPQILANRYVLVSKAPYSADMEYGNNPRFVPLKQLIEWIKRKKIIIADEPAAFAFAVNLQDKIRREGVNAQPFMRPAFYEAKEIWFPVYAKEAFK